jgi:RNA polymerase sigma-70 factor (ECF subfamily)
MSMNEGIRRQPLDFLLHTAEEAAPAAQRPTVSPAGAPNLAESAVSNTATEATEACRADGELVRKSLAGDRDAFGRLVDRWQKRAAGLSYRLLGNRDDALEVCQEAFVRAWTHLAELKEPEKFGPWLMRAVTNRSLNYRRDRKTAASLDDALPPDGGSAEPGLPGRAPAVGPVGELAAVELSKAARAALDRLPEKQRAALILFSLEGLPQQQVAGMLGTSVEAVKWHVFQARKKLRDELKEFL